MTAERAAGLRIGSSSPLEGTSVKLSGVDRVQVEFRIDDLIKRLTPGGLAATSCGGCNGCSGCSM